MTLMFTIGIWQNKRHLLLTPLERERINYEARFLLGELVHSGYLLSDVPFNNLKEKYLYDLFDALWKTHKSLSPNGIIKESKE